MKDEKQKRIESQFKALIDEHKAATERIAELKFNNIGAIKLQKAHRDNLLSLMSAIVKEYETVREQIVWDHLVVGLFGPTNAGKSTIIEALRLKYAIGDRDWNHGEIVGTGEADYTKDASEFDISINGHRVTLIDIPGIEGDETKYSEIIRKALRKAHFVLYVHNQDKTPDTGTTQKIISYLADWTHVISIYNVTNDVSNYSDDDDRITFITPKIADNAEKIRAAFAQILGKLYDDNIILQAQLALCSNSDFEGRKDLNRKAIKLRKYFVDKEAAYKFSNMAALCDLLEGKSLTFANVIFQSQAQKVIALKKHSAMLIRQLLKARESEVEILKKRLKALKSAVRTGIADAQSAIESQICVIVRQKFSETRCEGDSLISRVSDADTLASKLKSKLQKLPSKINIESANVLQKQMAELENDMTKRFQEFSHARLTFPPTNVSVAVSVDVDVDSVVNNVKVGFSDAVDLLSGAAGGWAVGGPWGAAAGVGLALLGKACFSDGGKGKAKDSLRSELDVCLQETLNSIDEDFADLRKKLESTKKKIVADIDKEVKNLDELINYNEILAQHNE